MASASKRSNKNYKGKSPNVETFIASGGNCEDVSKLVAPNLAAGAKLAAKNQSQGLDEKTARTYELRLMSLEKFAKENGDDAVLFGPGQRPFLSVTIQTFLQMLGEPEGQKLGKLKCKGLKPPAINGHVAAFRHWFDTFGHTGPYSQKVVTQKDGTKSLIPSGNPMHDPAVKKTIKQMVKRASRPTKQGHKNG